MKKVLLILPLILLLISCVEPEPDKAALNVLVLNSTLESSFRMAYSTDGWATSEVSGAVTLRGYESPSGVDVWRVVFGSETTVEVKVWATTGGTEREYSMPGSYLVRMGENSLSMTYDFSTATFEYVMKNISYR